MKEAVADWSVLDLGGIHKVARSVARKVANRYTTLEQADLEQDALVLMATQPTLVRSYVDADNLGGLHHAIWCDLTDKARPVGQNLSRHQSYEVAAEQRDLEPGVMAPNLTDMHSHGAYDRSLVEQLLPAVWDQEFAWGMKIEDAPDADMPRAATDPSKSGTLYAHLADVRSAWRKTKLTKKERRAVFLRFAFDLTEEVIAAHEGVQQQTINERLFKSVGKIVAHLNGKTFRETLDDNM